MKNKKWHMQGLARMANAFALAQCIPGQKWSAFDSKAEFPKGGKTKKVTKCKN